MNDFKDIKKIVEDYPFDEENPFFMEEPSEEISYMKDELTSYEDE